MENITELRQRKNKVEQYHTELAYQKQRLFERTEETEALFRFEQRQNEELAELFHGDEDGYFFEEMCEETRLDHRDMMEQFETTFDELQQEERNARDEWEALHVQEKCALQKEEQDGSNGTGRSQKPNSRD